LSALVHGLAHGRSYLKINAYFFEGSVSPVSWEFGQDFGDRPDLLQIQAGTDLNLDLTHNLDL
jgi:hypothetical protein